MNILKFGTTSIHVYYCNTTKYFRYQTSYSNLWTKMPQKGKKTILKSELYNFTALTFVSTVQRKYCYVKLRIYSIKLQQNNNNYETTSIKKNFNLLF